MGTELSANTEKDGKTVYVPLKPAYNILVGIKNSQHQCMRRCRCSQVAKSRRTPPNYTYL